MPVIKIAGLSKRFGATVALDGLELHVGGGQVHGFLGPNGAGKTTTIRVLLGLVPRKRPRARPVARRRAAARPPGLCARGRVAVAEPDRR